MEASVIRSLPLDSADDENWYVEVRISAIMPKQQAQALTYYGPTSVLAQPHTVLQIVAAWFEKADVR